MCTGCYTHTHTHTLCMCSQYHATSVLWEQGHLLPPPGSRAAQVPSCSGPAWAFAAWPADGACGHLSEPLQGSSGSWHGHVMCVGLSLVTLEAIQSLGLLPAATKPGPGVPDASPTCPSPSQGFVCLVAASQRPGTNCPLRTKNSDLRQ